MQIVQFPSQSPFLLRDASQPHTPPATIKGELYLPNGTSGPFPAVVLSQGLGGVKEARERRYGRFLAENGYACLVFDGFISRDKHRFSDTIRALRVSESMLLADAFAGLDYMAGRPDIRPDAISVMGFSYGGMISLLTAYRQMADLFLPDGPRFAAHISYYGCSIPRLEDPTTTGAPVLIYIGEKDANVNISRARTIADDLRRGGSPVDFNVFPGIYHQWDGPDVEKRHVRFRLSNSGMRVGRDNEVHDERTGLRMTGMASRTAMLAASAHPGGYDIQKHDETRDMSDRMTLELLARVSGREHRVRTAANDEAIPRVAAE